MNCPRAYHYKYILKLVPFSPGPEQKWGLYVHKAFEDYVGKGVELPIDLKVHEPFMQRLANAPGQRTVERKIALDKSLNPCAYFGSDVFYRGVIDYTCVAKRTAELIDYKTGKVKPQFDQLKLNAIHVFAEFPEVQSIGVHYYWTQTQAVSSERYERSQVDELWATFVPNLRQYLLAYKTDTWQPRQSGLCNGWCPVTSCEFWRPKRRR